MKHCCLTALGLVLNLCLYASQEAGTVEGKVSDRETGEPLAGVYVVYGKNQGVTTGQDGTYRIGDVRGTIGIVFQCVGFESVTREVTVVAGGTTRLDVDLVLKVSEIGQVVVSANRVGQKIAELSVSMDIIKNQFLQANHITDAQELVNRNPGIEVQDGQASIRGGSGYSYGAGSRVLVLIDGLPYLAADAGNIKWHFLPLENLSQVEIIKGASSVLYGSSALNGVINFRTAVAGAVPETRFFLEGGVYDRPRNREWKWWDSPRMFSDASFSHQRKIGRTDVGISGSVIVDESYRRLNQEKLGRLGLKLKHFSKRVEGLNYGLNVGSGLIHKMDFVLWENAATGALKQSALTAADFHGDYIALDPFVTLAKNDRYRHELRMRFQHDRNRLPENEQNNSNALSVYSEYQLWYRLSDHFDLTAGLTENYSKVRSNFFGDHHGLNLAGFAQLEARPRNRLKAVAGLRVENFSLDGINDRIVPIFRAGLNWQAAEYTFLRSSFGQGYRFPSIAEKFASTTLGSIRIIPNPAIMPEKGWSAEAGVKQGFLLGKTTGQADLSLFMMQNQDLIEFYFGAYPEGVGFRATNVEQARVYGAELEFGLNRRIGALTLHSTGGYSFIYPVDNSGLNGNERVYLKYRRMHTGKLYFQSSWKRWNLGFSLIVRSGILNIDDVFLNPATSEMFLPGFAGYWRGDNKGFAVMDLIPGFTINNRFMLSLAVKNISNTEYMGRPGDVQPQRNFSLRLTGKF